MQNDTIFLEPVAHVLHQQYEIHLKENIHIMWTHTRTTCLPALDVIAISACDTMLYWYFTGGSIIELLLLFAPFIMYLRGGQMSH